MAVDNEPIAIARERLKVLISKRQELLQRITQEIKELEVIDSKLEFRQNIELLREKWDESSKAS